MKGQEVRSLQRKKYKKRLRQAGIWFGWLFLWEIASQLIDNSILLVSPWMVLKTAAEELFHSDFWITIGCSFLRIAAGFFCGFFLGIFLAAAAFRFSFIEEAAAPIITLLKTIPVASFVVLLLIWWGSQRLSSIIAFLIVLPNLYINTLEGLKNTDSKLLEMAEMFQISAWNRFFYIYRPSLKPFLESALKLSLGMSWKSGVAAEVIGTPNFSIGEQLYLSKIYLDTAGVLVWTTAVIVLSICFEKLVQKIMNVFFVWEPLERREKKADNKLFNFFNLADFPFLDCELKKIRKAYGDNIVLTEVTALYKRGQIYFLTSPSGSGKTTLLRIIAGLEKPDSGEIKGNQGAVMVFQEDCLCESFSAIRNVQMVLPKEKDAKKCLLELLEQDCLEKPCSQLSGGMKRRVALVRAMEAPSSMVLLDEPFTGLDETNRQKAVNYICNRQLGRTIIIATHHQEDILEFQKQQRKIEEKQKK